MEDHLMNFVNLKLNLAKIGDVVMYRWAQQGKF